MSSENPTDGSAQRKSKNQAFSDARLEQEPLDKLALKAFDHLTSLVSGIGARVGGDSSCALTDEPLREVLQWAPQMGVSLKGAHAG